jgi:xanthine dehydrogenase YagR molybdenum-binding subunit
MVMTHLNAPAQGKADPAHPSAYSRAFPTLDGPEVHHYGEPVALVVADSYEQARSAANLVAVTYSAEPGRFDFAAALERAYAPKTVNAGLPTDSAVGDFDSAFRGAEVRIDHLYATPYQSSQPMEPHACLVVPSGEDLVVYVSAQILAEARTAIAKTLLMDEQRIRLVAPFVGGGFGSKLGIHSETILAAMAARQLKAPVKVVMTRQQIFHLLGVRPYHEPACAPGRDPRWPAGGRGPRRHHAHQRALGVCRADGHLAAQSLRRTQPADAAPADAAGHPARRGRSRTG